jgi:hypothetical protein
MQAAAVRDEGGPKGWQGRCWLTRPGGLVAAVPVRIQHAVGDVVVVVAAI